MSTNASYSSMAAASDGGAVNASERHCAAIVSSLTNASRGCLRSTRVRRPTSVSVLSRTPLQHVHALHGHDDLPTLIPHLEERSHEAAVRLRGRGSRLEDGGAHRQLVARPDGLCPPQLVDTGRGEAGCVRQIAFDR